MNVLQAQEKIDSVNEEVELLKNVQVSNSSMSDYENFQNLNEKMQNEIFQLRAYIQQIQQGTEVGQEAQILGMLPCPASYVLWVHFRSILDES